MFRNAAKKTELKSNDINKKKPLILLEYEHSSVAQISKFLEQQAEKNISLIKDVAFQACNFDSCLNNTCKTSKKQIKGNSCMQKFRNYYFSCILATKRLLRFDSK